MIQMLEGLYRFRSFFSQEELTVIRGTELNIPDVFQNKKVEEPDETNVDNFLQTLLQDSLKTRFVVISC